MRDHNESKQIVSVSKLARQARVLLEQNFANLWVEGELSNLSRPRSGHWYFTLKDNLAQVRCAMFANRNRAVKFAVRDGLQVMVRGKVSLYEGRGDFQIIVEHIEPAGEGALRAAFDALKTKLDSQGLFAAERKRPLPTHCAHIAVITSATGAALRDVLQIVERRHPGLKVTLLPVAVQGPQAEPQLLEAFAKLPVVADQEPLDAVLLTRGGGSLEDLWAFNLETVALAVAQCPVPVVSAIGHQTDFAITDFVADVRAPTPSAAAELLTSAREELLSRLRTFQRQLSRALSTQIQHQQANVRALRAALIDPRHRLGQQQQRVDELDQRLQRSFSQALQQRGARLRQHQQRLQRCAPSQTIGLARSQVEQLRNRLHGAMHTHLQHQRSALDNRLRPLSALNPLQTLLRGYAVLTNDQGVVESAAGLAPGAKLSAYLADGAVDLAVEGVRPGDSLVNFDGAAEQSGADKG